jgi:hypothetical protein
MRYGVGGWGLAARRSDERDAEDNRTTCREGESHPPDLYWKLMVV